MRDAFTCLISVSVNRRAGLVEAESCRASPAYGGRKRLPNLFPISITIAFIWKDKRAAASLAAAAAFPIMAGYRKWRKEPSRCGRVDGVFAGSVSTHGQGESGETVATASEKALKRGGGVVVSSNTQATDRKCQRCSWTALRRLGSLVSVLLRGQPSQEHSGF
jgi:hypothetical protein